MTQPLKAKKAFIPISWGRGATVSILWRIMLKFREAKGGNRHSPKQVHCSPCSDHSKKSAGQTRVPAHPSATASAWAGCVASRSFHLHV